MKQLRSTVGTFLRKGDVPLDHVRKIQFSLTRAERDRLAELAHEAGVSDNAYAAKLIRSMLKGRSGDPAN